MTDTSQVPAEAPAPAAPAAPAPAPQTGGESAPPGEAPRTEDPFDANWQQFLQHDFGPEVTGDDGPPAADEPKPGVEPQQAPPGTPSEPAQTPANAAPAAATDGQAAPVLTAPEGPDVDPSLLSAMLLAPSTPVAQPAPAPPQPATQAQQPPAAQSEPEQPWMPFQTNFRVPPQIMQGIFETDDAATREQALVALLAAHGNSVTAQVEQRFREKYLPQFTENTVRQVQAATTVHQTAQYIQTNEATRDLFTVPNGPAVLGRAFQVIASMNPQAQLSDETLKQAGNLARATLRQMGVLRASQAAPAPGAPPAAAPQAPRAPYMAGGARPAGFGGPVDHNSPGALLADLTDF